MDTEHPKYIAHIWSALSGSYRGNYYPLREVARSAVHTEGCEKRRKRAREIVWDQLGLRQRLAKGTCTLSGCLLSCSVDRESSKEDLKCLLMR